MDPLGAIGLIATVLAFLTDQVVSLKQIYHSFADYESDIQHYLQQVRACKALVEEWHRIWGESFSEEPELYEGLWGDTGFDSTKVNLALLTKQIDICLSLLRLKCGLKEPTPLSESDTKSVRKWLGLTERSKKRELHRDVLRIDRITYALWNNQDIHLQFEKALKRADILVTSSERFFRAQGHIVDGAEVTESYVKLCKNNIRTRRFASALYKIFSRSRRSFEFLLTMRLPDNDCKPQHLELVRRPRLDFAISFRVLYRGKKYRSERYYTIRQDPNSHRNALVKDIQAWHARDFVHLQDYAEISFEGIRYYVNVKNEPVPQYHCIRRKMDGRSKLSRRKNVKVTESMVDASLGLSSVTLWFILFHESGWFSHLHSSRLHRISSGEKKVEDAEATSIGGRTYMFRPWTLQEAGQHTHQHVISEISSDELLLLGMTVGELVLGYEVRLLNKNGTRHFIVVKNNKIIDVRARVLGDLIEEEVSLEMAEAIDYCIQDRGGRSVRMEEFQRKVVAPIWEYQNDVILPAPILNQA